MAWLITSTIGLSESDAIFCTNGQNYVSSDIIKQNTHCIHPNEKKKTTHMK